MKPALGALDTLAYTIPVAVSTFAGAHVYASPDKPDNIIAMSKSAPAGIYSSTLLMACMIAAAGKLLQGTLKLGIPSALLHQS